MCVQFYLSAQALIEHRVSLGVLCGLKQVYYPHDLPGCIDGHFIDWSGGSHAETEQAVDQWYGLGGDPP